MSGRLYQPFASVRGSPQRRRRGGRVVLERERADARVAGDVGADARDGGGRGVRAGVRAARTTAHPGDGVGRREANAKGAVVPAVRVRPARGCATGAVGGVLSIRTVTLGLVTVPHVNVAVHWRVVGPSTLISSAAGQPVVSTRSVGSIVHRIVTLLVYQLFVPAVPVSVKLIGAAAPGAAFARITLTRASTQIGKHNRRSDDPAQLPRVRLPGYLLILNVLEPRTRPYVGRSSVPRAPQTYHR